MITHDQHEVIDFLASPAAHGGAPVERIETHASIVFLAGDRALKLKRAVKYDYLDFSTADRRHAMCDAELRINAPLAPAIYRRVVAVTRERDGSLAIDGAGTAIDWLVEMARFDQQALFDRLAARGALDVALMRPLGAAIARAHAAAPRRERYGGRAGIAWVIDGNYAGLADQGGDALDHAAIGRLTALARAAAARHGALLDARRDAGLVRHCHGDLHLRNIVLIDGAPTLFDAVEFNDDIACIDVLYDVAFLLMDLWRRHLPRHANAVWNSYLYETGELEGTALLPLFLSCRAAVRAKTTITAANLEGDADTRAGLIGLARDYLAMAERMLTPAAPSLLAIGGLSGSGKSTVALALAPALGPIPGAVVIRSDEIRKQIFGVDPGERLGPEAYAPEVSRRVYAAAISRAVEIVRAGHSAIVDAVFARQPDREAIARAAASAHVPFAGVWLHGDETLLAERVAARRGDASDADAAIVRAQLREDTGVIRWRRIDAALTVEAIAAVAGAIARDAASMAVVA